MQKITVTEDWERIAVQRDRRDLVSGLIHFIGLCLSVVGLVVLLYKSWLPIIKPWHLFTFSIFGAGLILLYTASTLYHVLPLSQTGIRRLRVFDHLMIFLLIAGTYTPVCCIPLRGTVGWIILGGIWFLAILGIVIESFYPSSPRWIRAGLYIGMGWFVIVAVWPVINAMTLRGFLWLLFGGIFYTVGALIYAWKRPDLWPETFGFHEVFHVFVIVGSLLHYGMMYFYVLPCD